MSHPCDGCSCPLAEQPLEQDNHGESGGLVVVAEAPAWGATIAGARPFGGKQGEVMRIVISWAAKELGIPPPPIWWSHAVARSVPKAEDKPSMLAIKACRTRLLWDLDRAHPTRILTVGAKAWAAVTDAPTAEAITNVRGRMVMVKLPSGRLVPVVGTVNPGAVLHDGDWMRDLSYDVWKLLARDKPLPPPNRAYQLADNWPDALAALAELDSVNRPSVDLETEGFNPRRDAVMSVGIGSRDGPAWVFGRHAVADPRVIGALHEFLWDVNRPQVYQNAKFDLQFLSTLFQEYPPSRLQIADTMLMHFLLDERPVRSQFKTHGLKDMTRVYYDVEDYHFDFDVFHATPVEERDWQALYDYHAIDLRLTARLYWDLLEGFPGDKTPGLHADPKLEWVHDGLMMPATLALAEAEYRGALVDREYLEAYSGKLDRRLNRRLHALQVRTENVNLNPASSKQVEHLIFDDYNFEPVAFAGYKTSLGQAGDKFVKRNTRKEQLNALADLHQFTRPKETQVLRHIVLWRQDSKARQTYAQGLLEASSHDGRVHTSLNLGGASTGRLSSSGPNLQNVPKRGPMADAVRRAFIAPPGWVLMEADYKQLELVVAALLSQDISLATIYREGRDIHREVASVMFHKPAADLDYMERYLAKAVDFGAIYGRGGAAISQGAEMAYYEKFMGGTRWTPEEAQGFVDRFLAGFPNLLKWLTDEGDAAVNTQMSRTIFGRIRRYYGLTRPQVGEVRRKAMNTPIQSVASDLCLGAFTRLTFRLDPDEAVTLFPIHDSILLEVRKGHESAIAAIVRDEMERNLPAAIVEANKGLGIPFLVDIKAGPTWRDADMTDVKGEAP